MLATCTPTAFDHGRKAADAVRARGGDAMEAALAHIGATFGPYGQNRMFKDRMRAIIGRGSDTENLLRYRRFIDLVRARGWDVDAGVIVLANAIRYGRNHRFQLAIGFPGTDVTIGRSLAGELMLMLRFIRRYTPETFAAIVSIDRDATMSAA